MAGISEEKSTTPLLKGFTFDQILQVLNNAAVTPPAFSNSDLVGFPFNALFIDFMQTQNGRTFFSSPVVNFHLKNIFNDYGKMLKQPESLLYLNFNAGVGWLSSDAQAQINYTEFKVNTSDHHYGFKSWNDWFLRDFADGVRPVNDSPDVIVHACESTPLVLPMQPITGVNATDSFWLKDDRYSLYDMFGAYSHGKSELADSFVGGTVYQAFLSALSYHKWHSPVDGTIEDLYTIDGTYLIDQSQFIPFDEGSPNNSQSFLSSVAARMVYVIRANDIRIGKLAIIFIGMAEASSCVSVKKIGDRVGKGEQIGQF